jgi:hypothetical protein
MLVAVEHARLESGPLKSLQDQLISARVQLEKLKADVTNELAEIEAVLSHFADEDLKQEEASLRHDLSEANKERAGTLRELREIEATRRLLAALRERIAEAEKENTRLNEQIEALSKELKAIRDGIVVQDQPREDGAPTGEREQAAEPDAPRGAEPRRRTGPARRPPPGRPQLELDGRDNVVPVPPKVRVQTRIPDPGRLDERPRF